MNINVIRTSASLAAVAGILAASGAAHAAAQGPCDAYQPAKPHIYLAGSSATKPFIQVLGDALADSTVVIYVTGESSCQGVSAIVNADNLPTGADVGLIGTTDTCTPAAGSKADIGLSDVFPTSCPNVTAAMLAGIGDLQGPIQAMNFIVPKAAFDNGVKSISAQAAYLVFGFDPGTVDAATGKKYGNGTPWLSMDNIWVRDDTSGTQTMLGLAINVPASSWKATNYTDATPQIHGKGLKSGQVASFVANSAAPDTTIGILASTDLNTAANIAKLRGLAFQGYDQSCGYWPDSSAASGDFANVRNGKYAVWGPIHMLTKVKADKKTPVSADVATLIDYVNLVSSPPGKDFTTVFNAEFGGNVVPQCAMSVKRNGELTAPESISPTCGCYYDSKFTVGNAAPPGCVACANEGEKCTGANSTKTCSFGFCEAI